MKCPPERTLLRALKNSRKRGVVGREPTKRANTARNTSKVSLFFCVVLRFVSADARRVENCNLNRGGRTEEESFAPFFLGLFVCLFVSLGRFIGAGFYVV